MLRSRIDMRKPLAFLLVAIMLLGPASMAFAELSGLTVTPDNLTITTGFGRATFAITVTNDGKGTANQTALSIEGNGAIAAISTFEPDSLNLDRNDTADVTLTLDTTDLLPGDHTFYVRADAPAIGRGQTRQKSSSARSTLITLTVLDSVTPEPDPDPDPEPDPPPEEPPITDPKTFHYVALGNSLVLGTTGISGTMNSYVHGIFAHLKEVHWDKNVTMTILAVDGDDSTDLLSHLNTNQMYADEVTKADLITISIGGNNVMPAARDSSFWSINETMAQEGTERFLAEYPQILNRIRVLNTDATVVSATLYNPYNIANQPRGYSGDTVLHQTAAKYIDPINNMIRTANCTNYRVAEIHDHFLTNFGSFGKMGDVTFFYPRYSIFTWWYVQYTRDPHLNQRGQDLMRDIHINVIDTSQSYLAPIRQYRLAVAA